MREKHISLRTLPHIVQLVFKRKLPSSMLPDASEDPDSLRECLSQLLYIRGSILSGNQFSLLDLLQSSHMFKASDPRDKVYSLLGVAFDHEESGISIDYQKPVEDLYISVAKYVIMNDPKPCLDLLYSCLHRKKLSLPSWVCIMSLKPRSRIAERSQNSCPLDLRSCTTLLKSTLEVN